VLICAACVCRGVVEVVSLLVFIQRGLCCSSAVWAIVDQVAAAIKDKPGPATRAAISAQRGVILSLNIDIAMLAVEFLTRPSPLLRTCTCVGVFLSCTCVGVFLPLTPPPTPLQRTCVFFYPAHRPHLPFCAHEE
jgi:hypothetical protein